jgi:hypothetical protein
MESSGDETPSDPTKQEKIVLQMRRRLSMREAARLSNSRAVGQLLDMEATHSRTVTQLLDMKARVNRATEKHMAILRYLEWIPNDHPLPTADPLDELLFRLTQLMREAEHLHGMFGQEPAPWLLLCRDIDLLNTDGSAGLPTGYDKVYVDLCIMQTYMNAARTAMSVADTAGRVASPHPQAVALSWRIALQLESALWIYRGQNADPRLLVEISA